MPVTRWSRGDLVGARVRWLLDLTFAGRVLRLTHDSVSVASDAGDLAYVGCLEPFNVGATLDLFSTAATLASVRISGVLPVNVPLLVGQGHDLGAATGELSQWIEGTAYEDRRVVFRGRVRDPEYGADGEPVNFALEDTVFEDQGLVPEVAAAVSIDTWGDNDPSTGLPYYFSLADTEKGLPYPFVVGSPGRISNAQVALGGFAGRGSIAGSQGVWFWHQRVAAGAGNYDALGLIVAGHRVTANFVYLQTPTFNTALTRFLVKHRLDLLGAEVAYIDYRVTDPPTPDAYGSADAVGSYYGLGSAAIDSSFQPDASEEKPVFVSWYDPINPDAGGLEGPGGVTVRGAGDVLEALLQRSTMTIDRARIAAVKPALNRFKIDAVIEQGTKPWDWIRANLLPILPVSLAKGPDGVYLIVWRHDAKASDAIGHIDADADARIEVAPSIKSDTSKIRNAFALKYALALRTGNYVGLATLGATYDAAKAGAGVSLHCALSQRRYRVPGGPASSGVYLEEIQTLAVYDDDTAQAILAWRALAFAFARRTVDLLVPEDAWGWLERGNVVLVSVSWLYLSRVVVLVEDIEPGTDGMLGLRLLILEDPPRDARTTA